MRLFPEHHLLLLRFTSGVNLRKEYWSNNIHHLFSYLCEVFAFAICRVCGMAVGRFWCRIWMIRVAGLMPTSSEHRSSKHRFGIASAVVSILPPCRQVMGFYCIGSVTYRKVMGIYPLFTVGLFPVILHMAWLIEQQVHV